MTDKVYTQQELKEMADQLLAADDKKKAGKAAAQKAEEAKPAADKALEEKLAKCPAAALLGELICDPVTYHGRFVPEYFESEKTNLLEAIRSLINDKRDWADSRLLRALCDGEAYAVPRLGDEETVDKLQALKVYTQYRDLISTAPLEIIYSGSAELERVKQALAAAFATLPREEVRVISTAEPHVCRESVQYVEDVLDTFLQAITTRKVKNLPQYMKSLLWTSLATYKLNIISGITAPYKEVKNVYGLH